MLEKLLPTRLARTSRIESNETQDKRTDTELSPLSCSISGAESTPKAVASHWSLLTALLGFFIITLDALVVSVALPAIQTTFDGGIGGLQWVIDAYSLPFAALLLFAGTVSDRLGARTTFAIGLVVFTISSGACGLAPTLSLLVVARLLQGAGAALMTPASLALISEAYPDPIARSRAIGIWAVGGAVASASGPLVGGALTTLSWRLIFLINLPIGALALWLLSRVPISRTTAHAFDWAGQVASITCLTAITAGLIQAGDLGITHSTVIFCLIIAAVAAVAFLFLQSRSKHPMVPLDMFRSPTIAIPVAIGFTFMAGFFGMVFLVSLYFQQQRGLTPLETGFAFAPVTVFSIAMPIIAARLAERFGSRVPIIIGQAAMATGFFLLSLLGQNASVPVFVAMMIPVGLGAGLAMPSATSVLLNSVRSTRSGIASGVLNTSRQVGGALAVAGFGALVTAFGFEHGMKASFIISGALLVITMLASMPEAALRHSLPQGESSPASNPST